VGWFREKLIAVGKRPFFDALKPVEKEFAALG
jgi:hypothetical protein